MPRKKIKSPKPSRPSSKPTPTGDVNILATLDGTAMYIFNDAGWVIDVKGSPFSHFGILYLNQYQYPYNQGADFQLENYQWNGGPSAKANVKSLRPNIPGYWNSISDADGLSNAIVIGPRPETFILTAIPPTNARFTFATAYSPPPPQIKAVPFSGSNYLAFGFTSSLMTSFDVLVIG
jgi:hypothetical protein